MRAPPTALPIALLLASLTCASAGACSEASAPVEVPRLVDVMDVSPELLRRASDAADAAETGGPAEWLALAMLYDANYIEALAAFDRSLELHEAYAPTHWHRGENLFALDRLDEAEVAFARALELEPSLTQASTGLARVELMRGEPKKAIRVLEDIEERDRMTNAILARAFRQIGRDDRADRALQREERTRNATARDPWTVKVQLHAVGTIVILDKAAAALRTGNGRVSVELLEPLLAEHPDELAVIDLLARSLLALDRWNDALALIERAPKRHRIHYRLELTAGRAFAGSGAPELALPHLTNAVESNPRFGEAWVALGEVQLKLDETADAEVSFRRAIEEGRDAVRDWTLLARARIQLEQYDAAERALDEALEVYPNSAVLWSNLADAQVRAGRIDAARTSLSRAIERDPDYELIAQVRRRIRAHGEAASDG
jgi:tetratricopeptide (TPR) repeat protein